MTRFRCLIIDDEPKSAKLIGKVVESIGDSYDLATHQVQARDMLLNGRAKKYHYILLDLKLKQNAADVEPDSGVGLALLGQIREKYSKEELPILIMTAHERDHYVIADAMKLANDFMFKDCEPHRRLEKISGLVSRARSSVVPTPKGNGLPSASGKSKWILEIDENQPSVMLHSGRRIDLSPKEFDLVFFFAQHPNQNLRNERIIEAVWNGVCVENQRIGAVRGDIHRKLRHADKQFDDRKFLTNVYATGWKLNIPAEKIRCIRAERAGQPS